MDGYPKRLFETLVRLCGWSEEEALGGVKRWLNCPTRKDPDPGEKRERERSRKRRVFTAR